MASRSPFYKGRIAFISYTYATKNLTYQGGDLVTDDPKGFVIVCWENGKVEQVPYGKMRYYYQKSGGPGGGEVWYHVFPGMKEYPISDPKAGVRHGHTEIDP